MVRWRRTARRINQSLALFEKKYPEIRVKADFQDHVAFREEFQTRAAGGNPPDVFRNAVGFLRKYDKRGILPDLKSPIDAEI
ncbi:extracellular solute-binding protein [Streptomyces sp. NPDC002306]